MSTNLTKHNFTVSREKREHICGHKGKVLWFTGLSGSGKSTLANALDEKLNYSKFKLFNNSGKI